MPSEELLEKVSHLPTTPGVYLWRDQYNRIIYVGKAINLRNRVRSYVRNDANRAPKVAAMMKRAVDVEIIQTKTEMEKIVEKLNRITATKDYAQWTTFLSEEYKQQYSQPLTLRKVSEALPVKGIKLKSLRDYFMYVFVPSRQNVRVDDIRFVSPTRVDVIMKQANVSLLVYGLENINGSWKLIPSKL